MEMDETVCACRGYSDKAVFNIYLAMVVQNNQQASKGAE
jgi:hypothetical protein